MPEQRTMIPLAAHTLTATNATAFAGTATAGAAFVCEFTIWLAIIEDKSAQQSAREWQCLPAQFGL